ncbi:MAG: hypothetical protein ABJN69_16050 [Hellea sp.]
MSVLKMMLFSVGLTPESGAAYISDSLGRQISLNTIRTMMRSKTSVPTDIVDCLKARHDEIKEASEAFITWIEDAENQGKDGAVIIPHAHNKDDEIKKLGLAQAMLNTNLKCSISQK